MRRPLLMLALLAKGALAQDFAAIETAAKVIEKSVDPRARLQAVQELAELGSVKAIPALAAALVPSSADPRQDWFVRRLAASALVKLGPPAEDTVRSLVRHPSPVVRAASVEILAGIGAPDLVPLLATRLREEIDPEVRGVCLSVLRALGGPEALEAVARAAEEDADGRIRARAAAAAKLMRATAELGPG